MSTSQPTLVTFLLDRSGSMGAIWDETIHFDQAFFQQMLA